MSESCGRSDDPATLPDKDLILFIVDAVDRTERHLVGVVRGLEELRGRLTRQFLGADWTRLLHEYRSERKLTRKRRHRGGRG